MSWSFLQLSLVIRRSSPMVSPQKIGLTTHGTLYATLLVTETTKFDQPVTQRETESNKTLEPYNPLKALSLEHRSSTNAQDTLRK